MSALSEIGILILQTLGGLYLTIVLLRFLLQVARADYYNPFSQFVARATNRILLPMRRVIPGFFGLDMACLVLALAVEFVTIFLSILVLGQLANPVLVLAWSAIGLVSMTVYIYLACMFAMIVISWVAPYSRHPLAILAVQLVRPICAPFQRLIPPMGGLDISPMFVFLALSIVRILIDHAAAALGLAGGLSRLVPGLF